MEQKEKELLLVDLSARLLYGVICQIYDPQQDYGEDIFDARLIHIDAWTSHCYFWGCSETDPYKIEQVKPYLRPMSSMTEEDNISLSKYVGCSIRAKYGEIYFPNIEDNTLNKFEKVFNWLNANHFDYRGLIPKGLAIEAAEGMYNLKGE